MPTINAAFCSAVNCEWSRFSDWGECSVSCGGGIQQRRREVLVQAENGGRRCVGRAEESRICNPHSCAGKAKELKYVLQSRSQ